MANLWSLSFIGEAGPGGCGVTPEVVAAGVGGDLPVTGGAVVAILFSVAWEAEVLWTPGHLHSSEHYLLVKPF